MSNTSNGNGKHRYRLLDLILCLSYRFWISDLPSLFLHSSFHPWSTSTCFWYSNWTVGTSYIDCAHYYINKSMCYPWMNDCILDNQSNCLGLICICPWWQRVRFTLDYIHSMERVSGSKGERHSDDSRGIKSLRRRVLADIKNILSKLECDEFTYNRYVITYTTYRQKWLESDCK